MGKRFGTVVVVAVLALIAINSAFFTVDETNQAILVQLGKPVSGVLTPGIHYKIPFVQEAIFFERRLLDYDAHPAEILTKDKKNLVVDNYAKWKVVDPLKFYQTVRNVSGAVARLDDIIFAELRVELGRHNMVEIISQLRSDIMDKVTKRADERSREIGVSITDVRIKRADLPQENERAVFGRMQAEREREAKRYRSEGQEAALKLKASADREKAIILAEAYRQAQQLRGEGDAIATGLFAEAYSQDTEFFSFIKSLEAYRGAMKDKTTLVMSPRDEFLRYFQNSDLGLSKSAAAPKAPAAEPPMVKAEE